MEAKVLPARHGQNAPKAMPESWDIGCRSLLRAEFKLHRLAAHDIAKIVLPETSIAREMIDKKLESQPFPERKQLHPDGNFPEPRLRVIAEAAVVRAKVAKAEAIQVILVRGIAERAVIGVMRRFYAQRPA